METIEKRGTSYLESSDHGRGERRVVLGAQDGRVVEQEAETGGEREEEEEARTEPTVEAARL